MSICSVVINCADVSSSVAFYTSLLAARVVGSPSEEGAVLDLRTGTIELRRLPADAEDSSWEPDDLQRGFRHIGFKVGAVDPLAASLEAAGIRFHLRPLDAAGGVRICFFFDPDGTLLEFVEGDVEYSAVADAEAVADERALGTPDRPRLDHVAVTVADRDVTRAFYADRFGFTLLGTLEQPQDPRGFSIGYLRSGATVLEVFTFREATRPRVPQPGAPGFSHAVLSGVGLSDAGDLDLDRVASVTPDMYVDADGLVFATETTA